MLSPKKVKWRKHMKGRNRGSAHRGNTIFYGDYALQALTPGFITNRQIEAARIAMTRAIKRGGQVWIRIFPDKVLTKKPAEVRMGSGKGAPDTWVAVIKPGRILFEIKHTDGGSSLEALNLAKYKLPVKTKIIKTEAAAKAALEAAAQKK